MKPITIILFLSLLIFGQVFAQNTSSNLGNNTSEQMESNTNQIRINRKNPILHI